MVETAHRYAPARSRTTFRKVKEDGWKTCGTPAHRAGFRSCAIAPDLREQSCGKAKS